MSIETHVDLDVDPEESEGVATIVERRELHLGHLFQEGELRL